MLVANYAHKGSPYQHQIEGVHFAYGKDFFALFMEMATGKSKLLIDVVSNLFLEGKIDAVMLIVPNGLQDQWATEQLATHSPVPYETLVFKSGKSEKRFSEYHGFLKRKSRKVLRWYIVNVEAFSHDTYLGEFRLFLKENEVFLAIDEASKIKNLDASRTGNIIQGLAELTRLGKRVVACKPLSKYRAVMTGTPVTNNPFDLYAIFEFLKPGYFGMTFSAFKSRYGLQKMDHVPGSGKQFQRKLSLKELKGIRDTASKGVDRPRIAQFFGVSVTDVDYIVDNPGVTVPFKNLGELKAVIAPYSFVKKKVDCLDLPEKVFEKVYVEMGADQKRLYRELCADMMAKFGGTELTVANSLTLLVRLSQVTSGLFPEAEGEGTALIGTNPKIEAMLDKMEDSGEVPAIVLGRFVHEVKHAADMIRKRFPDYNVRLVIGEVGMDERKEIIDDFKAGNVDVLVATQRTIGMGFNLQKASVCYFLSNTYSMDDRAQTEDRIHRPGQTAEKCTYIDFLAKGTLDERVYTVLQEKKDLLEYMRGKRVDEFLGGGK